MFLKDVLGEARATAIEEDFRNTIEIFKQLTYREVRPWSEFLTQFKLPTWALKNIEQRVTTNMLHYRSNYLIIMSVILILQILFAPLVLVSLLACFILTIYLLIVMKGKSIVIGEVIINEKGKKVAALVISGILLLLSGAIGQIWWGVMYGVAICGIHSFLRPRNVSSKTNKLYEEFKLNGYNSWFGLAETTNNSPDFDPENPKEEDDSTESSVTSNDAVRKRISANGISH